MSKFLAVFGLLIAMVLAPLTAFATASSVTQTIYFKSLDNSSQYKVFHLSVTASSVDGSVADVTVPRIHGKLMKAIVVPGVTNPTASYTVQLKGPEASEDALNNVLGGLSASATQTFYPVGATGAGELWFQPDDYLLHITGNSVHSALVDIYLWFRDDKPRL